MPPFNYIYRVISQYKTEEKPQKILSTALKLFVEYGFHGTPTSKIAIEAGVSNGTLFHYFKTKDELITALYNTIKDELNLHLQELVSKATGYKEKFRVIFTGSIEWALQNGDAYFFIQQFQYSPHATLIPEEVMQKQAQLHMDLLQDAIKANVFKPILPGLIASISGSQVNGVYNFLRDGSLTETEKRKVLDESFELVWALLANPQ